MKNRQLGVEAEYGEQEYIITLFLQRKLQYILCIINKRELLVSPPMGPSPSHQSSWWFTETPLIRRPDTAGSWLVFRQQKWAAYIWDILLRGDEETAKKLWKEKCAILLSFFSICRTTNWLEVSGNFAVTVLRYISVIFLKYQITIALKYIWKKK